MNPDWDDAVPSWRQSKTRHIPSASSSMPGRAATASTGQLRQWATTTAPLNGSSRSGGDIPRRNEGAVAATAPMTALSNTGRGVRGSHSIQGLATVGLGNFKIGALHDMIQAELPHGEDDGGFFPGGLGVPDSFKGEATTPLSVYCCTLIVT